MTEHRFETTGASYDANRAANLRKARREALLSIVEAAAALEIPVLRYSMLENGETTFVRGGAWAEAIEKLHQAGAAKFKYKAAGR